MKTIAKCNATIADAIAKWSHAKQKKEVSDVKVIDVMYAEGVNPNDFYAPKDGADPTAFESYKYAVVNAFPADKRKLVQADKAVAKGFTEAQKAERRKWIQRIGADMRDLRVALERRYEQERIASLTDEQREAEAAEAAASATLEARFIAVQSDWVKKLQKAEACAFAVNDVVKLLNQALAIATAAVSKAK